MDEELKPKPWKLSVDLAGMKDFIMTFPTQQDAVAKALEFMDAGYVSRGTEGDRVTIYPISNVLNFQIYPESRL